MLSFVTLNWGPFLVHATAQHTQSTDLVYHCNPFGMRNAASVRQTKGESARLLTIGDYGSESYHIHIYHKVFDLADSCMINTRYISCTPVG